MNKRTYTTPQLVIVNMQPAGMLALSTTFGTATEPAMSPELDLTEILLQTETGMLDTQH